jgi:hypothetical protein
VRSYFLYTDRLKRDEREIMVREYLRSDHPALPDKVDLIHDQRLLQLEHALYRQR